MILFGDNFGNNFTSKLVKRINESSNCPVHIRECYFMAMTWSGGNVFYL